MQILIKQFLNEKELYQLKNWYKYLEQEINKAGGKNVLFWKFDNSDLLIKKISNKFLNIIGKNSFLDPFLNNLITEITPYGYADIHTDTNLPNHKHIRCNILINKPENGGDLIYGKSIIKMNEGDVCIIDTSINHGVSSVTGNKKYKLISFGFSVPI